MAGGKLPNSRNPDPPPNSTEEGVKETRRISIDYNPVSGRKKLNTYEIIKELGRGEHGRVKLGFDVDKKNYVAIKLLNRKEKPRLGRPQGTFVEEKIHREIAILKKCCHPNIVRLLEVLDNESSRKIYLVLEYCAKGEIKWQTPEGDPVLTREQTRSVARNVALGLEYLHSNGIIHRDIKPANLLVSDDNVVKISDFGVSYAVSNSANSELELAKTVGTPAFFSPELCIPTEVSDNGERKTPPIGAKVDVWAFGVTIYCLLYGYLPFEADNEYELFRVIANEALHLPDPGDDEDLKLANDFLGKLMIKDPTKRPTISETKNHPWLLKSLTPDQQKSFLNQTERDKISVSTEEVDAAVKGVNIKSRIRQGLTRIANHIRSRSSSRSRSQTQSTSSFSLQSTGGSGNGSATQAKKVETLESTARLSHGLQRARKPSESSSSSYSEISPGTSEAYIYSFPETSEINGARSSQVSFTDAESLASESSSDRGYLQSSYRHLSSARSPSNERGSVSRGRAGTGLMPMKLSDDNSLHSVTREISAEGLSLGDKSASAVTSEAEVHSPIKPHLPELEIPRLDTDNLWGASSSSSSSSEDDENGELTLVIGRNRSRSVERGRMAPSGLDSPPHLPCKPPSSR